MITFYEILQQTSVFSRLSRFSFLSVLSFFSFFSNISAQPSIAWQQSIGTVNGDNALQLFKDPQGDMIIIGSELHQDFTGNYRDYLTTVKMDPEGNEIWKTYHDIAFDLFNPPVDYTIGDHFFTEEFGEKLMNLVVSINNQVYLAKFLENSGAFYTYEPIPSPLIDVKPNNDKVYAITECSHIGSCYGPDSLIVQKFDPTPDSIIFNPIKWTYTVKQNIRTAPIQGHYDFEGQDIREDSAGNVYLLIQIERWDFQFCTDCSDAFVDAWCEVFKFSPQGQFLGHKRIVTSKAVVSAMRFVTFDEGEMIIRVDDINASNTAIVSSIYHVDPDLTITKTIKFDRQYLYISTDADGNLFTCTNIFGQGDPNIHGGTDVLVSRFNADGVLQWKSYLGGSNFEWPRGLVVNGEDDLIFLANTLSADFDVEENNGDQDMWVVRLAENTSATDPLTAAGSLDFYPNPASDVLHISNVEDIHRLELYDLYGRLIKAITVESNLINIDISSLPPGSYIIQGESRGEVRTGKVIIH